MTSSATSPVRATDVKVGRAHLEVTLNDGRAVRVPIAWFPRLAAASAEQRNRWRLIGRGVGIRWEELDEDLSVAGLLRA
ncbi:MAG: DUF2442 domain-containing protein [Acidimicrobiia bacterium]|nr:DUF2442 domain-containing protein [Acidimicrobiia bacterium]